MQRGEKGASGHEGHKQAQREFKLVTVQFINSIDYTNVGIQWLIQNFPRGTKSGERMVCQSIILQNVCRQLHENEIIWKERGEGRGPPPGSATGYGLLKV